MFNSQDKADLQALIIELTAQIQKMEEVRVNCCIHDQQSHKNMVFLLQLAKLLAKLLAKDLL